MNKNGNLHNVIGIQMG
jgi:hypothetical protein